MSVQLDQSYLDFYQKRCDSFCFCWRSVTSVSHCQKYQHFCLNYRDATANFDERSGGSLHSSMISMMMIVLHPKCRSHWNCGVTSNCDGNCSESGSLVLMVVDSHWIYHWCWNCDVPYSNFDEKCGFSRGSSTMIVLHPTCRWRWNCDVTSNCDENCSESGSLVLMVVDYSNPKYHSCWNFCATANFDEKCGCSPGSLTTIALHPKYHHLY
mmetsp:Transcript_33360/g.80668  ORF Transcript_33360/g.80668 Transcript_33360/m.80668 type:complete len:211 (-) Transcript_33360:587-1219(-)